jgi:intraflagellar transport protein 172
MPTRASRLLQQHDRLLADNELVSRVTSALLKGEFFEQAGELYERVGQQGQALDCYRRGEVNRWYTHKTSGFKTSGFKTSGFKTSGFKT